MVGVRGNEHGGAFVREANTTLTLPERPPVFGYHLEEAFPGLTIYEPIAFASPPGDNERLFVLERDGRVVVINDLNAPTRTVVIDLYPLGIVSGWECGLLGIAFHPDFAENRYFYLFYSLTATTGAGTGLHKRVSRFQMDANDPNRASLSSELPLITQFHEGLNHNAGDLHFGPDGYLYISVGDEGHANDYYDNAQHIDKDFMAGILRIDVDNRPGSLPPNPHPAVGSGYSIPSDNPFVGATQFNGLPVDPAKVRTELFAIGLRNPWRFSFDPVTGLLYCGDVGQSAREEVNIIESGRNYGWAFREGTIAGPKAHLAPAGFVGAPPLYEFDNRIDNKWVSSITGGLVYRGHRLSQLHGAYVFADFVTGKISALHLNPESGMRTAEHLTDEPGIVAFGRDPGNGDVLLADMEDDKIRRLVYASNPTGQPLPATLQETGVFANLETLEPNAGVAPYSVNTPFWSDHALKRRWFSVPELNDTIGFDATGAWSFPNGSVWIKHFDLELTNGVSASRKRLETRLLIKNEQGVHGLTYIWNGSTDNAVLAPEAGQDETFTIYDENGDVIRNQTWHYPSRTECLNCHTASGGHVLGFNSAQMNREMTQGDVSVNQLEALAQAGYFSAPIPNPDSLPRSASSGDSSTLEQRLKSYLAANCSQCHQPGGAGRGGWDGRLSTPLLESGLVNGRLIETQGNESNRVLKPGSLEGSILLQRVSTLGSGRMPPLASSELDQAAISLLSEWIMAPETIAAYSPNVMLANPNAGARLLAGSHIRLEADATAVNETVSRVEFLRNGETLGAVGAPPFHFSWFADAVGSHTLQAIATDSGGLVGSSSLQTVSVEPAMQHPRFTETGAFQLEIFGVTGVSYQLEWSSNLVDWFPFDPPLVAAPSGGAVQIADSGVAGIERRYYRFTPVP